MRGGVEDGQAGELRRRRKRFVGAVALFAVGAMATAVGALYVQGRSGDAETAAGILAGVGVGLGLGAVILGWKNRPWDLRWRSEPAQGRRERLLAQRARQLWLLPVVTLLLLAQATRAMSGLGDGTLRFIDYVWILLPVLYAWVVVMITMGRDHYSRQNRRYLDDELTRALRARALGTAFLVLMIGATAALALGLWRLHLGVMALPFALSAAGAAAGIRFAWLDREAGLDG